MTIFYVMKMFLLIQNPLCEVSSDGTKLENVLGDIPSSVFRAANSNVTFDGSEVHTGVRIDSEGKNF